MTASGLGSPLFEQTVNTPVGGTAPYYDSDDSGIISFTAPSSVFTLTFEWLVPDLGDRTGLVDSIILSDAIIPDPPAAPQWDTVHGTPDAQGGTGTWDTVAANFWDGTTNIVWPATSSGDDDAIFGGTAGTVTIDTGGITANNISVEVDGYTFAGDSLIFDGINPALAVLAGTTTFSANIDAIGQSLSKTGPGTLALQADADTGSFLIAPEGGTVTVASGATLSNDAATAGDNFGIRTRSNTILNIDGTVTSTADFFVTINAGGGTIDTNGVDKSADQIMEGVGTLTKQGDGTLLLTAENTYGGGTMVTVGCLSLDDIFAIPSVASVSVSSGAGFGGIVGASNLGDTDIQNLVDNAGWALSGAFLVIDTNGADVTVAADITGDIGLIKKGAGNLMLTGNNTYTGATVIEEGTIGASGEITITDTSYDAGNKDLTITFTSSGNVDVYRSPTLQAPWAKIGTNEPSGSFTDANATDPENFYILVPAGTAFP